MANLLPWLAVAGLGALHGLNPCSGWMFVTACGVRERDGAQARRALLPIADIGLGHALSIAVVGLAVAEGIAIDRSMAQGLAGALLIGVALYRCLAGGRDPPKLTRCSHVAIVSWSFLMSTVHGSGLMLVPALVPLCIADNPARQITASGSMALALAAVAVHTAAMLLTTGLVASGVCRGLARHPRLLSGAAARPTWTAGLACTGALLIALR